MRNTVKGWEGGRMVEYIQLSSECEGREKGKDESFSSLTRLLSIFIGIPNSFTTAFGAGIRSKFLS